MAINTGGGGGGGGGGVLLLQKLWYITHKDETYDTCATYLYNIFILICDIFLCIRVCHPGSFPIQTILISDLILINKVKVGGKIILLKKPDVCFHLRGIHFN